MTAKQGWFFRMIGVLCVTLVSAAPVAAQTVIARPAMPRPVLTAWADTTLATTNGGAYERLSIRDRRIARAIFESQKTDGAGNLTLDQIAALNQSGEGGWGRLYKDMHARGLVTEKNLGQAVSRYSRQQHASRGGSVHGSK